MSHCDRLITHHINFTIISSSVLSRNPILLLLFLQHNTVMLTAFVMGNMWIEVIKRL